MFRITSKIVRVTVARITNPTVKNLRFTQAFLLCAFHLTYSNLGVAQTTHPHILVNAADKPVVLQKIDKQSWAKTVYDKMLEEVAPYVQRHTTDKEWILSRYLMNRVPGKRYTNFKSDNNGTQLIGYSGDAPVPTVRVSPHKRPPVTSDGYFYKVPTIEELVPYDTSMKMWLQSAAPNGKKVLVDPQSFVERLNGNINELALNAAIVYWLTGKPEYAAFAADIIDQWARGAYYQNPIDGPCRTGFLSIQTLGDGNYETLVLAYDFVYDYMHGKNYDTKYYEKVFDKIANTMTFRGFYNNNWFAAQSPAMVYAALSLEDKKQRDYYLNFYLNKDTINNGCGHLALPSVVTKWLTPDGHWKEPGGYHNFPVSSLLESALAMEKNGYPIFKNFPALFQASYVMLKYSFPNFNAPTIGDTGPVGQSPECLEIGVAMADKYNDPLLPQLTSAMDVLIDKKGYKRESNGFLGLLTYLPSIPKNSGVTYQWPRSGELDFAKLYEQRNGTDKQTGLMYAVQGATYNHNHANGMSVELYGAGTVMGPDPGKGLTYEEPMHVNYYAQWAAHNTVISGGVSASSPYFKGGGGSKNMGQIKLEAMEPLAGEPAVSPYCSFTQTSYTDKVTGSPQLRTLAIVRTSASTGYYVDVYRSANATSNEYVYHNIGNKVDLSATDGTALPLKDESIPVSRQPADPPGLRFIKDTKSTGNTDKNVTALFSVESGAAQPRFMQVLFAGEKQRTFYAGMAPYTGTADAPYKSLPTPAIVARQQGEAWRRPFVAIYEPFSGKDNQSVVSVEKLDKDVAGKFTAAKVVNKDGTSQVVMQSDGKQVNTLGTSSFKGYFAVVSSKNTGIQYLYLGSGASLAYGGFIINTNKQNGAANLAVNNKKLQVTCNQQTIITVPFTTISIARLNNNGVDTNLPVTKTSAGFSFTVPAVSNATISFQ